MWPPAQPIENFPWKSRLRGKRHAVCRTCSAKKSGDWYRGKKDAHIQHVIVNKAAAKREAREFVRNYLSTHPGVDCGDRDPVALESDYVNGKDANVSRLVTDAMSIERIRSEIARCVVRCSNCHRRKTAKERRWCSWR